VSEAPVARSAKGLVLRNALFLVGGQLIGTPVAVLVNATLARYLGASDFGRVYVASTFVQFGILLIEWGQAGVLPMRVAVDHSSAGRLLGTALAWRACTGIVMYVVLTVLSIALKYEWAFLVILALVCLQWLIGSLSTACQDTIRGFERTDVGAVTQVGQQLVVAIILIPTLILGGRARMALVAQIVGLLIVFFVVWKTLPKVGISKLSARIDTLKTLLREGSPFMLFGVAMLLQSNIDAVMLSKLAPVATVGWNAVARRLIGTLVLPASALISAMYPTLSRLHAEGDPNFLDTTRAALRGTIVLAAPIAVCCWVYRDVGLSIFGHQGFGQAESNLRVLSIYLFLMYISMPIGSALMAAGHQKQWAASQFVCVAVSAILDPLLIPWFQTHYGNGGIGVCIAAVVSEVAMVTIAIALFPQRLFDRKLVLILLRSAVAGGAMVVVARLLSIISPFIAAPLVLLTYVGVLWAIGGVERSQIELLRNAIAKRRARA
jgi:O-antigen/teichoic acid export membrane protein